MNYANMIEEKNLKKGFIIATLMSTVIGTFTATMALHDKVKERREKAKQQKTDGSQDDAIKQLTEKVSKLSNGRGKDKGKDDDEDDDGKDDAKERKREKRSRSVSRVRRQKDNEAYFEENAQRSKDMIQQTFQDNYARLGPEYASGDLTTVCSLQENVTTLQQSVISVLQDAVSEGRPLTETDMRRITQAQNDACDGSILALNNQRDRILAERGVARPQTTNPPVLKALPAPEQPKPKPWETQTDPMWEDSNQPVVASRKQVDHQPRPVAVPVQTVPVAMPIPISVYDEPPRRAMSVRTNVNGADGDGYRRTVSQNVAAVDNGHRGESGRETSRRDASKPNARYPDPFQQVPLPRAQSVRLASNNDYGEEMPPPPKSCHPRDSRDQRRQSLPPQDWLPQQQAKARSTNSDPLDRRTKPRDPPPPPLIPMSSIRPSYVTSPVSVSRKSVRGSPPPSPTTIKALPAPPTPIFCRYARDLQKDPSLRLDKSFSDANDKPRCPACDVSLPVDTRDIWVLSTYRGNDKSQGSTKPRDYRMDARFVVKCHTAKGNRDGNFACILCERYRDLDCITKGIDGLVKHLGTAHTPAEFERDPDLVRMRDGSVVNGKSGRELVLR